MRAISRSEKVPTPAEFHEAIRVCSGLWYSACLRVTRNPQLAEDALQDAMLRAWQNREQFQGNAKLETWIHSIAVNSALTLLRKQRPAAFEPLDTDIEDPAESLEQAHHHGTLRDELDVALQQLTDHERVCFVLRHLEDWSLNEIATAMGKNANAVKQALFRGVRKLRSDMPTLAREVQ